MIGYRKAIIGTSSSFQYGHFINDMLCSLILVPPSYFIDSVIFVNFNVTTAKVYLKCLGIPYSEVFQLTNDWHYVSEAYFLRSKEVTNSLNVEGLPNLQKRFFKYLNLSDIASTKYRILNKKDGLWGRINNIEELTSLIQKTYPQYDFQRLDDSTPNSIYSISKALAEIKLLVTCGGSMVFNSIFMHKNTGIVICGSEIIDYPDTNLGYSLDIWMIYITSLFYHGRITDEDYNIKPVVTAVSYMLYAFENLKFPADAFNDYSYAYNLSLIHI